MGAALFSLLYHNVDMGMTHVHVEGVGDISDVMIIS